MALFQGWLLRAGAASKAVGDVKATGSSSAEEDRAGFGRSTWSAPDSRGVGMGMGKRAAMW